jgi:hypothetical protein
MSALFTGTIITYGYWTRNKASKHEMQKKRLNLAPHEVTESRDEYTME